MAIILRNRQIKNLTKVSRYMVYKVAWPTNLWVLKVFLRIKITLCLESRQWIIMGKAGVKCLTMVMGVWRAIVSNRWV